MKSMLHLTQSSDPATKASVQQLREAWMLFPKGYRWEFSARSKATDSWMHPLNDREIAEHWLYAHLVHADPDRAHQIRLVPETEQLQAALAWTRDGVIMTMATQRRIVELKDRGELSW